MATAALARNMSATNAGEIGLMYIAEQVSPSENTVSNLKYTDNAGVRFAEFDTVLQTFRCINRNGRKYWGPNIDDMLKAERILTLLSTNAWYGEQFAI